MAAVSKIRFDVAQAKSTGKKLNEQSNVLKSKFADLEKKVQQLKGNWEGDSAEAYLTQFDQLKPELAKMVTCVQEIGAQITKIADIKEKCEADIKRQINKR